MRSSAVSVAVLGRCLVVPSLPLAAAALRFQPPRGPSTSLRAFRWPTPPIPFAGARTRTNDPDPGLVGERNGLDPDYPWRFEGRLVFRPSLVRVDPAESPPMSASLLSVGGYSLGGTVVLEYDASPVGPYREYVSMGGLVAAGRAGVGVGEEDGGNAKAKARTLGLGQWGSDLRVNTRAAEEVCRRVWGVPAGLAEIDFAGEGDALVDGPDGMDGKDEGRPRFAISGWDNARILDGDDGRQSARRYGGIPIYWTPTIKALWAPVLFGGRGGGTTAPEEAELLPLHKLRLSASAVRLKRCERKRSPGTAPDRGGEIPLGLALVVDNVLIEIGEQI